MHLGDSQFGRPSLLQSEQGAQDAELRTLGEGDSYLLGDRSCLEEEFKDISNVV